jgi:hypothetical protein
MQTFDLNILEPLLVRAPFLILGSVTIPVLAKY